MDGEAVDGRGGSLNRLRAIEVNGPYHFVRTFS
jgi:hypothetical protein